MGDYVYRVDRPGCPELLYLREAELKVGDTAIGPTEAAQIVQVRLWKRRYTYVWDGAPPLRVGELVVVPPPPSAKNQGRSVQLVGKVMAIGSDYPGPLAAIIERAQP